MYELDVFALGGQHVVSTGRDLAEALSSRVDNGNHFEIASTTSTWPLLDLLVRDSYVSIHYFPGDGMAGDQAVSNVTDAPDEVDFPHQSGPVTLPGSVLVDLETAVACVEQFAETLARPTLVEWITL